MRVRGGLVALLVVVLAAVGAVSLIHVVRQRTDQRDLRAARTLARHVTVGPDAAPSTQCRGDGLVGCWTSPQQAMTLAQTLAASMRTAGGRPSVRCERVTIGVGAGATTADECHVIARFGSRAATAFIDPQVRRVGGASRTQGSLISVAAA